MKYEVQYFWTHNLKKGKTTSYQNYVFKNRKKCATVHTSHSTDPLPNLISTQHPAPVGAIIYHTDQVGSALCTAARASTWTVSACPGWASSPGTRLWTAAQDWASGVSRPSRMPPSPSCETASSSSSRRLRSTSCGPSCNVSAWRWDGPACPSSSPRPPTGTLSCRHWCCGGQFWRMNRIV